MARRFRRLGTALLAAVLAAGCGAIPAPVPGSSPGPAAPEQAAEPAGGQPAGWAAAEVLGACPPDLEQARLDGTLDMMILPDWLYRYAVWTETASAAVGPEARHPPSGLTVTEVRLTGGAPLRGVRPDGALVRPEVAAPMQAELSAGATILLGLTGDGQAGPVASLRPDGAAVFIGLCAMLTTHQLRNFVQRRAGTAGAEATPAEMLRALVRDPDGGLAQELYRMFQGPDPVPWTELPPDRRQLTDGDTPPEVLAGLHHIWVRIAIPPGWRSLPAALCFRTSLAWGACAFLHVFPDGTALELTSYAVPGEDLAVWLMDSNGSEPLAWLGAIPTARIAAAAASQDRLIDVEVAGGEDAAELEALLADVERGGVTLRVPGPAGP